MSKAKSQVLRNVPHFPGSLGTPGILTTDVLPASQQMWPMNKHPCGAGACGGNNKYEEGDGLPSVSPSPAPRAAGTPSEGEASAVLAARGVGRTLIRVDLAIL